MKKVVMIHTSFVSVDYLNGLFRELVPGVKVHNIVDDSLLDEITRNGGVTKAVAARYCTYALQAQSLGADLIFNQCSSAGPAADIAAGLVDVPILKIDLAMAEEAVTKGSRIAVVGTVESTMKPSTEIVRSAALRMGKTATVTPYLVEGALDVLMKENNREKHNKLVLDKVEQIIPSSDVIVFAQGSMVALSDAIAGLPIPVLTSPRSGVLRARQLLGL
jgi:Asp/Glu/hydantoin racemase